MRVQAPNAGGQGSRGELRLAAGYGADAEYGRAVIKGDLAGCAGVALAVRVTACPKVAGLELDVRTTELTESEEAIAAIRRMPKKRAKWLAMQVL